VNVLFRYSRDSSLGHAHFLLSLESSNDFVDLEPNTVASQTLSYTAIPMTISRFNITTRLESNRDVPTEREIVLKQLIHKRNCTS
jgi:hypothetical protein